MVKKALKTLSIIIILGIVFLMGYAESLMHTSILGCKYYDDYSEYEYYKEETYFFSNNSDEKISRFYYLNNPDEIYYKKNPNYIDENKIYCTLVGNDIEKLQESIKISFDKLNELDKNSDIEFNYENITSNDYYAFYKKKKYDKVYNNIVYFDVETHIRYEITYSM